MSPKNAPAPGPADGPNQPPAPTAPAVTDPHADVATLSYEDARGELTTIVARLESGQVGLEESMVLWERGEALAKHCESWLDAAEAKLRG